MTLLSKTKNRDTTALNADGTVPGATPVIQPTGAYQNQNLAYQPQAQQPVCTGQHGFNSGPTLRAAQPNQGQYGPQGYGRHGAGGIVGHTQRDGTEINHGQYQYGGEPPPGGGYTQGGGAAISQGQYDPINNGGSSSLQRTIGKVESAIGSLIGSDSLKAKGQQKEGQTNSLKFQGLEIAEAERLEQEALMRRERAVNHGAHPAQAVLGGPFGPAAGGPPATYN